MLRAVPLLFAIGVIGILVWAPYSRRLDGLFSRVGYRVFEGTTIEIDPERERTLRAAGIGTPYREYVVKTYVYTFGGAITGAILGVYLGGGTLFLLSYLEVVDVTTVALLSGDSLGSVDVFVFLVLLLSSGLSGAIGATVVFLIRWQIPSIRGDTRRRQIDAGMPQMVAFVYALSRGGMSFPDVMRALARNKDVFGEAADEMSTGVRNLDVFNVDLVTAVQDLADRTPSEQFERFAENMTSVLQSGRNMSEYLRGEYERYREEAEEQQREILDVLATTAEMYVTVVVAGLLFLITILLVIGLVAGDTLLLIQLITYLVLPAGNVIFLAYLSEVTQPLRATRDTAEILGVDETRGAENPEFRTGSGFTHQFSAANHGRLTAYRSFRSIKGVFATPIQSALDRPELVLYVVVPVATIVTMYRFPPVIADGSIDYRMLDDHLVQAVVFVFAVYGVVYEISQRRLRRLEETVPDFLERLASLNEAGISIVSSFDRVRQSDIGQLDTEVNRIWRDIELGASVSEALTRFESRVRTPSITRVVTLLTNAMHASNEIAPVLRIAADQARSDRRLARLRRQEMMTYLVVIYVAFFVFLVVIVSLDSVLIPNLPQSGVEAGAVNGAAETPGFLQFDASDADSYQLVFFHAALLQSALSGLVAGMMSRGTIKAGVKHSTIMLVVTYAILTVI